MASTNPGNFANRPKDEVREIASKGGQHSHGGHPTEETQTETGNNNPGNFANRPHEEVQAIASKGGQASSGSFEPGSERAREAGHKGGLASHGEAEEEVKGGGNPGNFANRPAEEVREIARKGGKSS